MRNGLVSVLVGAAISLAGAPASSAPLTFFGEDVGLGEETRLLNRPNADSSRKAFLSNLIGVGTEDFEGFPRAVPPLAAVFSGAGTATLTGVGRVANVPTGTNFYGRFPISGNQYFEVSGQFVLTFSDPVAAFGFYGVDIGDFNGQVTLAYTDTKGVSTSLTVPSSTNNSGGSVLYFGFIDTERPFKSLAFGNTTTGTDFFGFDDFTIASLNQVVSVPAPAALALFSFALLGLGMVRLRA